MIEYALIAIAIRIQANISTWIESLDIWFGGRKAQEKKYTCELSRNV